MRKGRPRSTRQTEVHFQELIMGLAEANARVGLFGLDVSLVHIETQAADIVALRGLLMDAVEKGAEHAATAPVFADIHALNPPEEAVAPVAPLGGDHQLT